jgi:hypothetical protein
MKKLYVSIIACIVTFVASFNANSQKSEFYENNTWYLDKQTAIDSALSQDKQMFVCYGRETCGYTTNVRKLLGTENIKQLVDDNYVLWFVDGDIFNLFGIETGEYFYNALKNESLIYLPVICLVNKYNIHYSYGVSTGPKDSNELISLLSQYVANDKVTAITSDIKVYVSEKELVVNGGNANEAVSVYSITGSLVDKFKKNGYIARDASSYPSGILIVSGSSGWTKKVINKK